MPSPSKISDPRWDEALDLAPAELVDATLELHWAAQVVASAGQTFAEPRDDDSHRSMLWDEELAALVGVGFAGPYPFRLALRPSDLTLLLLDRVDGVLSSFDLPGRLREEAYEWLAVGMATYRGGALPLIERPEYDLPEHPVGDTAPFTPGRDRELRALSALYGSAAALLTGLFGTRADASDIRCWPHHFDIATLLTLDTPTDVGTLEAAEKGKDEKGATGSADGTSAEDPRTVGVGLAPMGGGYDGWYLYVTPWPYPEAEALGDLPEGRWHTDGWTGAVLTGEEIRVFSPHERAGRIRRFVLGASTAARTLLR